jgi:hypothetical protein
MPAVTLEIDQIPTPPAPKSSDSARQLLELSIKQHNYLVAMSRDLRKLRDAVADLT